MFSSIQSQLQMTRYSALYFIPGADLIWGILTLAQYKVTNVPAPALCNSFLHWCHWQPLLPSCPVASWLLL